MDNENSAVLYKETLYDKIFKPQVITLANGHSVRRRRSRAPLIVVLLAPFVEEVLFRGLVFGCLREKSRIFAYLLSCALFALLHVWTAAVSNWDLGYLILMLQYLVPGLVFAWAYEHSGTLWTSILIHALVNALSLFTIAS